jgi:transposase
MATSSRRDEPGGARAQLTADQEAAVRAAGPVEQTRKQLARNLIADLRAIDTPIKHNTTQLVEVVHTTGSTLTTVDGIGPVLAGRIVGRTRRPSRFATGSQFAAYPGTAPIGFSSAERTRHRLPRGG